jgi:hypothetical protein
MRIGAERPAEPASAPEWKEASSLTRVASTALLLVAQEERTYRRQTLVSRPQRALGRYLQRTLLADIAIGR